MLFREIMKNFLFLLLNVYYILYMYCALLKASYSGTWALDGDILRTWIQNHSHGIMRMYTCKIVVFSFLLLFFCWVLGIGCPLFVVLLLTHWPSLIFILLCCLFVLHRANVRWSDFIVSELHDKILFLVLRWLLFSIWRRRSAEQPTIALRSSKFHKKQKQKQKGYEGPAAPSAPACGIPFEDFAFAEHVLLSYLSPEGKALWGKDAWSTRIAFVVGCIYTK